MVDEAHRTQYGILGGRMSKALPNAVMVGFTGTPIEKDFKRSTIGRFGPLIDALHDPAVGGRRRDGAHLVRGAAARARRRGTGDPGQVVRGHVRRRAACGPGADSPPLRQQGNGWPRRSGASR